MLAVVAVLFGVWTGVQPHSFPSPLGPVAQLLEFPVDSIKQVEQYHVWVLGATGAGKTTLIRLLTREESPCGRSGFRHDTINITDWSVNVLSGSDANVRLSALSIMDTRGYADVSYGVEDLARDLLEHRTFQLNKILLVVKTDRLQRHTWDMLKAADYITDGTFATVLTDCDDTHASKLAVALEKEGVRHGAIVCYNERNLDARQQTREEILLTVLNSRFCDIATMQHSGIVSSLVEQLERLGKKHLKKYLWKALDRLAGADGMAALLWVGYCVLQWAAAQFSTHSKTDKNKGR